MAKLVQNNFPEFQFADAQARIEAWLPAVPKRSTLTGL